MDIKEVLNLPTGTKVKVGDSEFEVTGWGVTKMLCKIGIPDKIQMHATLSVVNADYELVRKKLNFFEAMRLVDEGKTVESNDKRKYKKSSDGLLVEIAAWDNNEELVELTVDEITSDWYEVIE